MDALRAAVRHRRGLVVDRKVVQQRLHDQLNALCPGSVRSGRSRSVVADRHRRPDRRCWRARPRSPAERRAVRSLPARAPGRMTEATAQLLGRPVARLPATAARRRPARLERLAATWTATRTCRPTSPSSMTSSTELLAGTDGQILTTLPGVGVIRAAAFAAFSLPIKRFPDAEHLYSATGLAPALYQSATLHRRGRIIPTGSGRAPRRADGHGLGPVA